MNHPTNLKRHKIPDDVASVLDSYPVAQREKLLALRHLILDTANTTPGVGQIEETLKWGELSYLTSETKSGSTLRIGPYKRKPDQFAIFFNCQTNLVETFRQMFSDQFQFEKNRAIWFHVDDVIPVEELRLCIAKTLCYHVDKRRPRVIVANTQAPKRSPSNDPRAT